MQTQLPECTEENAQKQSWILAAILERKDSEKHFGSAVFI